MNIAVKNGFTEGELGELEALLHEKGETKLWLLTASPEMLYPSSACSLLGYEATAARCFTIRAKHANGSASACAMRVTGVVGRRAAA